jgi:hypothetical protein
MTCRDQPAAAGRTAYCAFCATLDRIAPDPSLDQWQATAGALFASARRAQQARRQYRRKRRR